jgi:sugar phosphate isomerase/epimerase
MILLGGPVSTLSQDPYELADAHRRFGYQAAYCPNIEPGDSSRIAAVRDAFKRAGIVLAEHNAWGNLVSPREDVRAKNLARVCERLAVADEVGALCTVDYLGTRDPKSDYGPHPDNLSAAGFDLAVQTVRKIVDAVKPRKAKFALEMMQWIVPDSVDCYARLLEAVDRPAFGVHLDPVNIIVTPRQYFDTGAVLRECFAKLGPRIVSCHAKDLVLQNRLAMHLDEVRPGLGALDYRTYLSELAKLGRDVPLMLEHLSTPAEYAQALRHLRSLAAQAGVA